MVVLVGAAAAVAFVPNGGAASTPRLHEHGHACKALARPVRVLLAPLPAMRRAKTLHCTSFRPSQNAIGHTRAALGGCHRRHARAQRTRRLSVDEGGAPELEVGKLVDLPKIKGDASVANANGNGTDAAARSEDSAGEEAEEPFDDEGLGLKATRSEMLEVLRYCIPVFGSMVSDPLMGVVDTACVGQVSTVQLASLGPAMNIFLFVSNVFGFLGTATSTLIATNAFTPMDTPEERRQKYASARGTILSGIVLSLLFGSIATMLLVFGAEPLLRASGAGPDILSYAASYTKIRGIGITFVMLGFVAHGACMGQGDTKTPLYVFAAAGLVNLLLDCILIFKFKLGGAGAAFATMVSGVMGTMLAAFVLWRRDKKGRALGIVDESAMETREEMVAILISQLRLFCSTGLALLVRQVATMVMYSYLTTSATRSGTMALAVWQVALQVFWFLTFLSEPLSVVGQSLVARTRTLKGRTSRLTSAILKQAAIVSVAAAALTYICHNKIAFLFTSDPAVIAGMRGVTPYAMTAHLLCGFVVAFDGLCIGLGDVNFLPVINILALGIAWPLTAILMRRFPALGLTACWLGLVAFFLVRLVVHMMRVSYLKRKFGFWPVVPNESAALAT